MPACMAHYEFGQEIIKHLDEAARLNALAYKVEFDIGLQGPDIFFFYKPYRRNAVADYGKVWHSRPGSDLFAPILEKAREGAALSYLTGLICHYVLDKTCHPYIYGHSLEPNDHQRMESAFDSFVMRGAGLSKDRYLYLPVSGADYEAMASLWPGMAADTVKKCVRAERRAVWLLDHGRFLGVCETVAGRRGAFTPMTLPDGVPAVQTEHVRALRALYDKALDEGPALLRQALKAMGTSQSAVTGFELNYKGKNAAR